VSLRARLDAGEPLRALLVKMPAPGEVELAGHAGFDVVILDTEHGPASGSLLEHHLRAADAARVPALVRVPGSPTPQPPDSAAIQAALDAGAQGVVVPHVSSPETAQAVAAAARYPPRGTRGFALTTRAGRYATTALNAHLAGADARTLVLVQIEDREAVGRAHEILSVDGIDGVLIGTGDLSLSLGHPGESGHPAVGAAVDEILHAAAAAGRHAAMVLGDPAQIAGAESRGVTLSVLVDTQLVRDAFTRATARRARPAPPAAEPVLFLPGMLGTAELWGPVIAGLCADGRVRRIGAEIRVARIDLDDTVAEMAASVLATAPARFGLAGHSLGAIVALEIVRRAPERVARLALLNASARPGSGEQLAAWTAQRERIAAGEFPALCDEFAATNAPNGPPELLATLRRMAGAVGARGFDRQLAAQASRPDARAGLAAIACPTVVLSGAEDRVCPPVLQEELTDGIPPAELVRLDGCGHMSPLQAPERVGAVLAGWLA